MKKRALALISSTVLLTAAVTIGVSTTWEAASVATNFTVQGDDTTDRLPESLRYDSEHPDVIHVNNTDFIKSEESMELNNENEVSYDVFDVTDNTKYIVAFDAIYIKSDES